MSRYSLLAALFLASSPAVAQENVRANPAAEAATQPTVDTAELSRRIDVLAQELERMKIGEAAASADRSQYGLGPAASKVYRGQGVSLGGYGETVYEYIRKNKDDGTPSARQPKFDLLRAVLYTGYKFSDRWVVNSEIEFEHGGKEIGVEFAYLDYLWRPELNFRVGNLLVPMGLINELHEPTTFLSADRPDTERQIIPSTWHENGVGVFGSAGPLTYRAYAITGFKASGFSSSGLRGGRQGGSEALAQDWAAVVRTDFTGVEGLLFGASGYYGGSDQSANPNQTKQIQTAIYDVHLDWQWRGLQVRGLLAGAHNSNTGILTIEDPKTKRQRPRTSNEAVGKLLQGYYGEIGYDVLSPSGSRQALIPFVRWEHLNPQKRIVTGAGGKGTSSLTTGFAFKPLDQIIFKADYKNFINEKKDQADELNLAVGYVF